MDSWTFSQLLSRHFSSVGITYRCYLTSGTRETIHPSYQTTARTPNTLPCALPGPDSLVTACGSAVRLAVRMTAVGGAVLHDIDELADQAW